MERFYLTSKGTEYFAKTATGQRLVFTKGKFGDGQCDRATITSLTDLVNPLGEMPISKQSTLGSRVTIQTQFSNKVNGAILDQFYLNEIGLYAKIQNADGTDDTESPETLVAYAQSEGQGDNIPKVLTEFIINWPCTVSNTDNVTVEVGSLIYVTTEELEANYAKKSVVVNTKLLAKGWTNGIYKFTNENITSDKQIVELVPQQSITVEQLNALQYANIVGTGQSVGMLTLQAMGEIPTVDIPVTFIVRGDV